MLKEDGALVSDHIQRQFLFERRVEYFVCFQQITLGTACPAPRVFTSKDVCLSVTLCDLTTVLSLAFISLLSLNEKAFLFFPPWKSRVDFCARVTAGIDCCFYFQLSGRLLQILPGQDVQRGGGDGLCSVWRQLYELWSARVLLVWDWPLLIRWNQCYCFVNPKLYDCIIKKNKNPF